MGAKALAYQCDVSSFETKKAVEDHEDFSHIDILVIMPITKDGLLLTMDDRVSPACLTLI